MINFRNRNRNDIFFYIINTSLNTSLNTKYCKTYGIMMIMSIPYFISTFILKNDEERNKKRKSKHTYIYIGSICIEGITNLNYIVF